MSDMGYEDLLKDDDELDFEDSDIDYEKEQALLHEDEEDDDKTLGNHKRISDDEEDVLNLEAEDELQDMDDSLKSTENRSNAEFQKIQTTSTSKAASQERGHIARPPSTAKTLTNNSIALDERAPKYKNPMKNDSRFKRGKNGFQRGKGDFQKRRNTVLINPRYQGTVHVNDNARLAWDSQQQQAPNHSNYIRPWASDIRPDNGLVPNRMMNLVSELASYTQNTHFFNTLNQNHSNDYFMPQPQRNPIFEPPPPQRDVYPDLLMQQHNSNYYLPPQPLMKPSMHFEERERYQPQNYNQARTQNPNYQSYNNNFQNRNFSFHTEKFSEEKMAFNRYNTLEQRNKNFNVYNQGSETAPINNKQKLHFKPQSRISPNIPIITKTIEHVPEKKARVGDEIIKKKTVETIVTNNNVLSKSEEEEEERLYRQKIEEQKRLREEVLRRKEESRKKAMDRKKIQEEAQQKRRDEVLAQQRIQEEAEQIKKMQQPQVQQRVLQPEVNASKPEAYQHIPPISICKPKLALFTHKAKVERARENITIVPTAVSNLTFEVTNNFQTKQSHQPDASSTGFMSNRVVVVKNNHLKPNEPSDIQISQAIGDVGRTTFFNNRKVLKKDSFLIMTKIVRISNLAASTDESQIMSLTRSIGEVQHLQLDKQERQATIVFKSVASAHAFFRKYQRHMLDLSMIEVKLEPML